MSNSQRRLWVVGICNGNWRNCKSVRWYVIIELKILKGVYNRGDPPLSIPNREVKPLSADGTALWWESRLAPNCESSHDLYCDCFFYVYENSPRGRSFWAILESRLQYPVCSGCRGCHIFLKKYSGKFCPLLLSRSVINNCVTRLEYLYFSPLSIFRTFTIVVLLSFILFWW